MGEGWREIAFICLLRVINQGRQKWIKSLPRIELIWAPMFYLQTIWNKTCFQDVRRAPFELHISLLTLERFIFPKRGPICVGGSIKFVCKKMHSLLWGEASSFLSGCWWHITLEAEENGEMLVKEYKLSVIWWLSSRDLMWL